MSDENAQPRELSEAYSTVTFGPVPSREDLWSALAGQVRGLRDFLRYLHPRYANASKLARRAGTYLFPPARLVRHIPLLRGPRGTAFLTRILKLCERAIPRSRLIEDTIRSFDPDIVLVTPLVDLGSPQLDYLKSAIQLGLPAAHCVASWDNLTTKGLIQIEPDLVVLWNEEQKKEALELHGIPEEKVVVTGAQLYDHWFSKEPATTREELCARIGLDPGRRYLLYLCSSVFITSNEVEFVKKWIRALRSSSHEGVRGIGVLVRPHPSNAEAWRNADLSPLGNAVIWPRRGAHTVSASARADFFDSMHHSAATVGINTSASIESAIVGRPSYTILAPEFAEAQGGTLHFAYLKEGGLLTAAGSLEEHVRQIEGLVEGSPADTERSRRFLERFVRPHGLDVPCTPLVADAIERLGTRASRDGERGTTGRTPPALRILTLLLWPFALAAKIGLGSLRAVRGRGGVTPRRRPNPVQRLISRSAKRARGALKSIRKRNRRLFDGKRRKMRDAV